MITEDYVSFEIAKLLKEKGFNELCNRVYEGPKLKYTTLPISPLMSLGELGGFHPKQLYVTNNELGDIVYTAPTPQMAMKWLRETHHIIIVSHPLSFNVAKDCLCENWVYSLWVGNKLEVHESLGNQTNYPTYEEACEAAIKYCLENLI